jgi:hypothetical protein
VRWKKIARLASGFVFLLANPEFYSHLASWRVVIRTPALRRSSVYEQKVKFGTTENRFSALSLKFLVVGLENHMRSLLDYVLFY